MTANDAGPAHPLDGVDANEIENVLEDPTGLMHLSGVTGVYREATADEETYHVTVNEDIDDVVLAGVIGTIYERGYRIESSQESVGKWSDRIVEIVKGAPETVDDVEIPYELDKPSIVTDLQALYPNVVDYLELDDQVDEDRGDEPDELIGEEGPATVSVSSRDRL